MGKKTLVGMSFKGARKPRGKPTPPPPVPPPPVPPSITSNGGGSTASIAITTAQIAVTTVTATGTIPITFSKSGPNTSLFSLDSSTGALALFAPQSAGVYNVTVIATNAGGSDSQAIALTVSSLDVAPTITSNGGGSTANISITTVQTSVTTVTATGTAPITFTKSGPDSALFSIGSTNGVLVLLTTQPAGSYSVTVTASNTAGTDSQAITLAVAQAAVAPTITSNGGGSTAAISITAPQTAVTTVTATGTAPITYTRSGADAALFSIGSSTGVLALLAAQPAADYHVTVIATNTSGADSQDITLTVAAAIIAPVITSNGGGPTATIGITIADTAITTVTATGSAPITYSKSGTDAALFSINSSSGVLALLTTHAAGALQVIVTATNTAGADNQTITVNVSAVASYQGNPNVTISTINTSGGIVASRTSGLTPCFIQVSASAITATGTSIPYEDLEYSWGFGDLSGTETLIDPTTGTTVNLNSVQTGPEAAYCYRSAGTYTVTLNIRGKNGGSFTTASVTATITVTAFTATTDIYVDSTAGGGGSGSIGSPYNNLASVNTAIASATDNCRVNIKGGSTFTGATGIDMSGKTINHVRFVSYGGGATPLITVNGANSGFFTNNGGGSSPHPQDDIVVSGINFATATGWGASAQLIGFSPGNATATESNFYLDNVTATNIIDPTSDANIIDVGGDSTLTMKFGMWKCTSIGILTASATAHCRQNTFMGVKDWFFAVGNTLSGSGQDPTRDHHIYVHVQTHTLGSFNNFGATATAGNAPTKNFCFKTSFDSGEGDGGFYAQYFCISRNFMSGTQRATDAGNSVNDPTITRIKNYVGQQNSMSGLDASGSGGGTILPYCAETRTERDHKVWNCKGDWWAPAPAVGTTTYLIGSVYRNRIYKTDATDFLNYVNSATWSTKQEVTDNIFYGTSASANLNAIKFADQVSSGSVIDRNNYYAPNATSGLFNDTTQVSLATWQAGGWDTHVNAVTNSNNANPGWIDPANGVF